MATPGVAGEDVMEVSGGRAGLGDLLEQPADIGDGGGGGALDPGLADARPFRAVDEAGGGGVDDGFGLVEAGPGERAPGARDHVAGVVVGVAVAAGRDHRVGAGIARPGAVAGAVDIVRRADIGLVDDVADGIVAVSLGFALAVIVGVVDGGPGEPVEVVEGELLVDVLDEVLAGGQVAEAVEQIAEVLDIGAVSRRPTECSRSGRSWHRRSGSCRYRCPASPR